MRHSLVLAILLVTLGGCAGLTKLTASPKGVQTGSYDCAPAGRPGMRHLTAAVAPDRNGRDLDLTLEPRRQLILSPLGGASGQLYSSPLYAWRAGSDMSVLTDVENIQTYDCRQLGDGKAVTLPGGRADASPPLKAVR